MAASTQQRSSEDLWQDRLAAQEAAFRPISERERQHARLISERTALATDLLVVPSMVASAGALSALINGLYEHTDRRLALFDGWRGLRLAGALSFAFQAVALGSQRLGLGEVSANALAGAVVGTAAAAGYWMPKVGAEFSAASSDFLQY